jgi:hypothetical protein
MHGVFEWHPEQPHPWRMLIFYVLLSLLFASVAHAQTTGTVTLESACSGSNCTTGPSCATYSSGVLTGFAPGACGGGTSTSTAWNVIVPTGTAATDTGNINTALTTCSNTNAIFLAETGTHLFAINATIDLTGHDGCTIVASISGTPYAGSSGTQNTVVDCSGLSTTTACFKLGTSDTLTGFAIKGNGGTAGSNTVCVDNETAGTGGNTLLHMVMLNCGYGLDEGSSTGTVQNDRLLDVTFSGVGTPVWCHGAGGCTGNHMTNLTMLAPAVGILCDTGCTKSNFAMVTEQALGGTGIAVKLLNGSSGITINNLIADQGSCIQLNGASGVTIGALDCRGASASANNYCLDFESNASTAVSAAAMLCSTGYSGSGSSIFHEAGVTGGCINCTLDVSWNQTDPLYTGTTAEADLDWQRFMHPIGYKAVTLTSSTFAAPDLANGFNVSLTGTSSCPCTLPAPTYVHDGQSGYIAFTQPTPSIANAITWNGIYANTSAPVNTAGKTTWYPWTAVGNNGSINLGPSFHN